MASYLTNLGHTMTNILLVEDDKIIAESITFALEKDAFEVTYCELGSDALEHVNNNPVDLVLLDIGLPDMNGFDVLRKIRATYETPVIIITARDDDADIVLGLEGLGADDYVTKPLSSRVLVARVKTQLRHTNKQPISSNSEVFKINDAMKQVVFQGETLTLTALEFKILAYLIKHPNKIHSKEHLLNIAWGRPTGSSKNTITTHIKSIRKTLNKVDPDCEFIKTHRGEGYSLVL
jgi:two-component system catabolic regulation response regulator CreB